MHLKLHTRINGFADSTIVLHSFLYSFRRGNPGSHKGCRVVGTRKAKILAASWVPFRGDDTPKDVAHLAGTLLGSHLHAFINAWRCAAHLQLQRYPLFEVVYSGERFAPTRASLGMIGPYTLRFLKLAFPLFYLVSLLLPPMIPNIIKQQRTSSITLQLFFFLFFPSRYYPTLLNARYHFQIHSLGVFACFPTWFAPSFGVLHTATPYFFYYTTTTSQPYHYTPPLW